MYNIAVSIILTILFVTITIVSEKYNLTVLDSFKKLFTLVKDLCKSLSAEKAIVSYPIWLGYDNLGQFCPAVIDKIFEPLHDALESLYLVDHQAQYVDYLVYEFKFINVKTEADSSLSLYNYIDNRVNSIVVSTVHNFYNIRLGINVTAIKLDSNTLSVFIAKNSAGEKTIAKIRKLNRNNIINTNINNSKPRGPININWQQLQQNQQNQQSNQPNNQPTQPPQPPKPPKFIQPPKPDQPDQPTQSHQQDTQNNIGKDQ